MNKWHSRRITFLFPLVLFGISTYFISKPSFPAQESGSSGSNQNRDFFDGYRIGFISAVREEHEGTAMCTKNASMLQVLEALRDFKQQHPNSGEALTSKLVKSALSSRFPCK